MIETVMSFCEKALKISFVPAVSVAVPELERVVTNCRLILKLVSLTPSLSVVNSVFTTSKGNFEIEIFFSAS